MAKVGFAAGGCAIQRTHRPAHFPPRPAHRGADQPPL